MKILVPVKTRGRLQRQDCVKADGTGVDLANVKMSMNPFDEIVEEAVCQKKNKVTEIVLVSIARLAQDIIRAGMAIGADRVWSDDAPTDIGGVEPLAVANLKAIAEAEKPDMIIMGKQSIDDDSNQTGQMLAALLNWPQGTFASKVELGDGKVDVTREVDGGLETVSLKLPAIVTTDLRLNEPRYAALPNIMKAKSKPMATTKPEDYGVDLTPRLSVMKVAEPKKRTGGGKVASVDELIDKLKNEAKVL